MRGSTFDTTGANLAMTSELEPVAFVGDDGRALEMPGEAPWEHTDAATFTRDTRERLESSQFPTYFRALKLG